MARKKPPKGSWIVRMRATVTKEVVCDGCTEEEATNNPWDYASDEREVECVDYDVTDVRPNS